MCLNSSSSNDNFVRGDAFCLEFLDDLSSEIANIVSISLNGHAQSFAAIGSLEDVISENFISAQECL